MARELPHAGARVVLACRNLEKGESALREIQAAAVGAEVELAALDLGSLQSVGDFTERFRADHEGLDLLVNNAGVMAPPRKETADGFELQFGTNHLGHFALTGLLLGAMEGRDDARVVTLTSGAHRMGQIGFDDLQWERSYSRWRAYGRSKLANLLFALELDRRLRASASKVKSLAAHPGYAATNLQSAAAPFVDRVVMVFTNVVVAQSAEKGALPQLYAATHPGLESGEFIGPDGFQEQRGHPTHVTPHNREAYDQEIARRLWEVSEELTGVRFDLPSTAAA
jgi:NAD(P)-dependent dehydrogenase (short-subunit alcohol dehydrogenase family)